MRKLLIGSKTGIVTPAVYATEAVEDYRLEDVPGHLVYKTHEDHPLAPDDRVIFLFRHPMDSFVSYMHMAYREGYHTATTPDELRPYLVEVLGEWSRLAKSALARRGNVTLIQSYEELLRRPATVLSQVLAFLGVGAPVSLEEAVKSASLKNWIAEVQDTRVASIWGFDANGANTSIWESLAQNRARVDVWRKIFPRMFQEHFYRHESRPLWIKLSARAECSPASMSRFAWPNGPRKSATQKSQSS